MNKISVYVLPLIFFGIIGFGLFKKINVFDAFLDGASEGLKTVIKILPTLVGLIAAITMFKTSGALDFIVKMLSPVTKAIGIPPEVMPLALLRPVSGSGSLAVVSDIFKTYGTDSEIGRIASVMMGSTETTFYTLCVYFGAEKITDSRHAVFAALLADMTSFFFSSWIYSIFF